MLVHYKDSRPAKKDDTQLIKYEGIVKRIRVPQNGVVYALTISPNPKHFEDIMDPREQVMYLLPKIYKHFKHIGNVILVVELHDSGSVHFHGTICMKDAIKQGRTLNKFVRTIGFMHMRELDGSTKWHEYCQKEADYMRELINIKHLYVNDEQSLVNGYITAESFNKALLHLKSINNIKVNIMEQLGDNEYIYDALQED